MMTSCFYATTHPLDGLFAMNLPMLGRQKGMGKLEAGTLVGNVRDIELTLPTRYMDDHLATRNKIVPSIGILGDVLPGMSSDGIPHLPRKGSSPSHDGLLAMHRRRPDQPPLCCGVPHHDSEGI